MRIISLLVTLPMLWVMLFPQTVGAANLTDETKIKFELKRNFSKLPIPYNFPDYQPIDQGGKFVINASAYTAAADECGKSDGITASGKKVQELRTLACPRNYTFGTRIKIEGFGTYTCEDRGGAIKGNHFDIYMETKAEAFDFGRRNLLAQVVE